MTGKKLFGHVGRMLGLIGMWLLLQAGLIETDADMKRFRPQYTDGFAIEYLTNGVKKLRDNDGRSLWLVPRGVQAPPDIPKSRRIPVPLQRAVFTSVSQVSLLRPFQHPGVWRSVAGVTVAADQWYIPAIKNGLRQGSIVALGDGYHPDYELLQTLRPEVVFVYSGPAGLTDFIKKLDELEIPYVVDNSYLETDPLARMEWVQFFAAFYQQERAAEAYLVQAGNRVAALRRSLPAGNKPKIAWGAIYNGQAYVAGGHSFVARMIEWAGGEYVFKKLAPGKGSVPVSMESFYAGLNEADLLIYATFPQYAPSLTAVIQTLPILAETQPFRQKTVWALQPWYNQQQDKTDIIIRDLAALFYPKQFEGYRVDNFERLTTHEELF